MEMPAMFRHKMSGKPKLDDEVVGYCREAVKTRSIKELAQEFGVRYMTMYNAVKGNTYRHLNGIYPPQW